MENLFNNINRHMIREAINAIPQVEGYNPKPILPQVRPLLDEWGEAKRQKDALKWLYASIPASERDSIEAVNLDAQIAEQENRMQAITARIKEIQPSFYQI